MSGALVRVRVTEPGLAQAPAAWRMTMRTAFRSLAGDTQAVDAAGLTNPIRMPDRGDRNLQAGPVAGRWPRRRRSTVRRCGADTENEPIVRAGSDGLARAPGRR